MKKDQQPKTCANADALTAALQSVRRSLPEASDPTGGLKTTRAYIQNLADCPENPRYWTINKQNKAFAQKVMDGLPLAVDIFLAVGFEDHSESLEFVGAADRQLLWDALAKIDLLLQQLE